MSYFSFDQLECLEKELVNNISNEQLFWVLYKELKSKMLDNKGHLDMSEDEVEDYMCSLYQSLSDFLPKK